METTDTLGRRTRNRRKPRQKSLTLKPRDLLIFQQLHEHGDLPTPYLYAYTQHLGKDYTGLVKRLNVLFHAGYLDFPPAQRETENANSNHFVHSINAKSESVLFDYDLLADHVVRPSGPWKHQCMIACLTASIELATQSTSIHFIPAHEILQKTDNGLRATISIKHPATKEITRHDLVPDGLFGLEYQTSTGKKYLSFLIEADRGTERLNSDRTDLKTFKRNVLQYHEFIGRGIYKNHFGLKCGMMVLTVTTKPSIMKNMVQVTESVSTSGKNSFMLFQTVPEFGRPFKPTIPVDSLLHKEWHRAGYKPIQIDRI